MYKHILIFAAFLVVFAAQANAELYSSVDEKGNTVVTDNLGNIPNNQRSKATTMRGQESSQSTAAKDTSNQQQSEEEARRRFKDVLKKEYGAKESCPKETKEQVEQEIKSTWTRMSDAMISGNIEKALTFISPFTREQMKRTIGSFSREQIKSLFSDNKGIEIESLREDLSFAECGIIREEPSGTFSYPASFGRDLDCEWRIRRF